jgi:phosphoribosylamine-glycine ligase
MLRHGACAGEEGRVISTGGPLALAIDALEAAGIKAFGPNAAAARPADKAFPKLMRSAAISTAEGRVSTDSDAGLHRQPG